MQNRNIFLVILIIIIAVVIFGGYITYLSYQENKVVPANSIASVISSWKRYVNNDYNFELRYPEIFAGKVWNAEAWPPVVVVLNKGNDFLKTCGQASVLNPSVSHENKDINSMNFVVYKGSDAGAGQLYSNYCYVLDKDNKYYVINFVIHSTNGCGNDNCGPYCGTENEQACRNFDMQKEVVNPLDKIISTLKFF